MLALFNLGLQELIILGLLGLLMLAAVVVVVFIVSFTGRGDRRADPEDD